MAQSKTSKTARRSSPTGPKAEFQADADAPRITPLGIGEQAGRWAYVRDSKGRTLRLAVTGDDIVEELRQLIALPAPMGSRVAGELGALAARYPTWADLQVRVNTEDKPAE